MRITSLLLSLTLALSACGGGGSDETPVLFTTVLRTQQSGIPVHEEVVLRGNSELTELWGRITVDGAPLPAIDFADFQVVGVFLGRRTTGCHHVTITRITRNDERVLVRYRETVPQPGEACPAVVVTPAHLVLMARSPLPVVFATE